MSKPYGELRNEMTAGQHKRVKAKVETLKKEPKPAPKPEPFSAAAIKARKAMRINSASVL